MERLARPNIERLFKYLQDISNKNTLEDTWLHGLLKTDMISYSEMFCCIYDDNQFEYFLTNEIKLLNFGEELQVALLSFEKTLNEYDKNLEKGMEWEHEKILKDKKFDDVIEKAKRAVELWKKDPKASKFILLANENTPKEHPKAGQLILKKTFWEKLFGR